VPRALEVVSATADNWKAAKFVFSKELDKDTVKKENFTGPALKTVVLLDDNKTVVVVLDNAVTEQSKSVDITVKNVKAKDGATIAETKKSVVFVDNTIPAIRGASVKNAKAIVIAASEPLNAEYEYYTFEKIKIDGVEVAVESSTTDYKTNNLTLNLISALEKGSHKIEIGGLKDFAGYVAPTVTYDIDVPEDTTPPEIVSGKVNSTSEIEVTFNEDIAVTGSFKVNGENADATQDANNRAKFKLTNFVKKLDIGATVEIVIKYKDQEDVVGNKVESEKTFIFKVEDDTTLPTVSVTVGDNNELKLTFSKNMDKETGTVKIYDKDDKQIGNDISLATDATWDGLTVAKIAPDTQNIDLDDTDEKEIKIKISDCKDATVRANALPETTITVKVKDTKEPNAISKFKYFDASDPKDDTITFYFTEAMDEATLKNLSNYVITTGSGTTYTTGKALAAISGVSVKEIASDKKSITIKAEDIGSVGASLVFRVYAIKDVAGNMMVTNDSVGALNDATDTFAIDTITAKEENKVIVEFTQEVKSVALGAFSITDDSDDKIASVASRTIDSDNPKKVTLMLSKKIGTTDTANIYLYLNSQSGVKDVFGRDLSDSVGRIDVLADEIKPYAKLEKATDAIKIVFSEAVNIDPDFEHELIIRKGNDLLVYGIDYEVEGGLVGRTGVTDIKIISKTGTTAIKGGTEYRVSIVSKGAVVDGKGNKLAELAETKITPNK
jgi:hypothetical protein